MITGINESKILTKHILCEYKYIYCYVIKCWTKKPPFVTILKKVLCNRCIIKMESNDKFFKNGKNGTCYYFDDN